MLLEDKTESPYRIVLLRISFWVVFSMSASSALVIVEVGEKEKKAGNIGDNCFGKGQLCPSYTLVWFLTSSFLLLHSYFDFITPSSNYRSWTRHVHMQILLISVFVMLILFKSWLGYCDSQISKNLCKLKKLETDDDSESFFLGNACLSYEIITRVNMDVWQGRGILCWSCAKTNYPLRIILDSLYVLSFFLYAFMFSRFPPVLISEWTSASWKSSVTKVFCII